MSFPVAAKAHRMSAYNSPLPLEVFPAPAVHPTNPLTYVHFALCYLLARWNTPGSHAMRIQAHYSTNTTSVNIVDERAAARLWRDGFFGKGNLSRSEPEYIARKDKRKVPDPRNSTATEVTHRRRQERKDAKRQRAQREALELEEQLRREGKPIQILEHASKAQALEAPIQTSGDGHRGNRLPSTTQAKRSESQLPTPPHSVEHLQLSPEEAFFLSYGLGVLDICTEDRVKLSNQDLLTLFCQSYARTDATAWSVPSRHSEFMIRYAVYHHYRSLGWVVRPGVKFAVDYLLYARGPVFSHAEFAVVIDPHSFSGTQAKEQADRKPEKPEWWYVHSVNRVQGQVLKTLLVAYVDARPSTGGSHEQTKSDASLLCNYVIRDFVVKRWTANRNRG